MHFLFSFFINYSWGDMMRRFSVKNKNCQETYAVRFLVETATSRRYACVGDRSVLVATGIYPVLTVVPTDIDGEILAMLRDRAERLNRCYRRVIKAFLEWCMGAAADAAKKDYDAMGERAPYCFRRREFLCNITTEVSEVSLDLARLGSTGVFRSRRGQNSRLHVTVRVSQGVSRSHDTECFFERRDVWRLPDVTMERLARRRRSALRHRGLGDGANDGDAVSEGNA